MRFLDTLLGRSKPVRPDLDALFALPSAALTLTTAAGLSTSGQAAICFKPVAGQSFAEVQGEIEELLQSQAEGEESSHRLHEQADRYGYRWMVVEDPDIGQLVTEVHMVNSTLTDHGYGPQLLCSVFGMAKGPPAQSGSDLGPLPEHAYLVYLYKRGTFYPFVPTGDERRDSEVELRIRAVVGADLPVEGDLSRWFPLWGLPLR